MGTSISVARCHEWSVVIANPGTLIRSLTQLTTQYYSGAVNSEASTPDYEVSLWIFHHYNQLAKGSPHEKKPSVDRVNRSVEVDWMSFEMSVSRTPDYCVLSLMPRLLFKILYYTEYTSTHLHNAEYTAHAQ